MEKLLEEIRDLLQPKENFSIVVSSDTTAWSTIFSSPLYLNPQKHYELALVNLETYNSIPNLDSTKNTFVYSPNRGTSWKTIVIPEGSYEIEQINDAIHRQLDINGDKTNKPYPINVGANGSTLRAFIEITSPDFRVNMTRSTVRSTLGFEPQTLGIGYKEGEKPVDILSVDTILVNCDAISGSYRNGSQLPVVYSFFPSVPPGFKIIQNPANLVYLPVTPSGNVSSMRVWLTDQDGKQLNLRGETITIRFHIRSA